jgi:hypothetical protein
MFRVIKPLSDRYQGKFHESAGRKTPGGSATRNILQRRLQVNNNALTFYRFDLN